MALQFLNEDTGDLKSAVFCFTGKSPKPRDQMTAIAVQAGASITASITKSTTILVIADANSKSQKAEKAREMDIDLISPEQFFEMCKNQTLSNTVDNISRVYITKPKPINKNSNEKRRHSSVRRVQL